MNVLLAILFSLLSLSAHAAEEPAGACRKDTEAFTTEDGGCHHLKSGLTLSMRLPEKKTHSEAASNCSNLDEAGFKDWRLPTRNELIAIAESSPSRALPFASLDFFWASNKTQTHAAQVTLEGGEIAFEPKSATVAVVCVRKPVDRDGDGIPDSSDKCNRTPSGNTVDTKGPRKGCAASDVLIPIHLGCLVDSEYFTTNGGGCKDLRSGIVWGLPSKEPQQRQYAQRYCERLIEGFGDKEQRDWRLPTQEEAHAIAGKELALRHLRGLPDQGVWTSSIMPHGNQQYQVRVRLQNGAKEYIAAFVNGTSYASTQELTAPVVCVRNSP